MHCVWKMKSVGEERCTLPCWLITGDGVIINIISVLLSPETSINLIIKLQETRQTVGNITGIICQIGNISGSDSSLPPVLSWFGVAGVGCGLRTLACGLVHISTKWESSQYCIKSGPSQTTIMRTLNISGFKIRRQPEKEKELLVKEWRRFLQARAVLWVCLTWSRGSSSPLNINT